jgi:hypothetical protein
VNGEYEKFREEMVMCPISRYVLFCDLSGQVPLIKTLYQFYHQQLSLLK